MPCALHRNAPSGRAPATRRAAACGLAALVFLAPAGALQLPPDRPPPSGEVNLPVDGLAVEALRRGDLACLRALAQGADAQLRWAEAFEAWHAALADSPDGAAVPAGPQLSEAGAADMEFARRAAERWPDRDHSFAQRTEAVEVAVLRRLSGLESEERAAWSARFAGLALERLVAADPLARDRRQAGVEYRDRAAQAWAQVERLFPATPAAVRAALARFELDFEAGRPRQANAWLERAERHAALVGGEAFAPAIARRRAALLPGLTAPPAPRPAWTRATSFEPVGQHRLTLPDRQKPAGMARIEGQPGLCFLADGRAAVQTTGTIWVLPSPVDDHELDNRAFEPWRLADELGQPIPRFVDRTGKDWPFFPRSIGDDLVLVSGRADEEHSNFLQRIRAPRQGELPKVVWSLGGAGLFDDRGRHQELEELLTPGLWEFQPGPLVVEDLVLVQARQWPQVERDDRDEAAAPNEAQAWLLALEAGSGRLRWKRSLCRGRALVDDFGLLHLQPPRLIRTPGEALVATRSSVFVGTNLGAGSLLDLADGRLLWSLRNRRRDVTASGWRPGGRPEPRVFGSRGGPGDPGGLREGVLWAPADSDEAYALSATPDFAARGAPAPAPLVPYPPLAADGGEQLVGGGPEQVLVFARAGARKTLAAHDLTAGRRYDSIYLGREEDWLPGALVSEERVLFAADGGLYLLDRQRELYLSAFEPLDAGSDFAAGGLWANGDALYLLARGALFQFRLR